MEIWKQIYKELNESKSVVLLTVIENMGSSPGKQGFKMLIKESGELFGSVGGGVTEHKLVEKAKKALADKNYKADFHKFVHRKDDEMYKSGMICSGEHSVAFYPITPAMISVIENIIKTLEKNETGILSLTPEKFEFDTDKNQENQFKYTGGVYSEIIGYKDIVCIIGAGHVGFALSQTMKQVGFYVKIYDNRPNLDTFENNTFADEKHLIKYHEIDKHIEGGKNVYIVIMSFSHVNDKTALTKLIRKELKYIGLMGSDKKIETIKEDMLKSGFTEKEINKASMPVGIKINSETPAEIAVSVAAEIIKTRNAHKKQIAAQKLEIPPLTSKS